MLIALYSIVILVATTLGAFVGLGGGVIIKPILDFIGAEPRIQVDFLSAVAVFTMSIVSTVRQIRNKVTFDKNIILFIAFGSILGGFLGGYCMDLLSVIAEQGIIRAFQAFILALLLSAVCVYVSGNRKSFNIKNKGAILSVGFALGFLASFLGIGGGPINVAVLTLFFSLNVKESAVYSVAIIFFSQLSKLIMIFSVSGIQPYAHQWKTLIFILPAAVLGGYIGSKFNRRLDDKVIRTVFVIVMILLVILNIYNCINQIYQLIS